MRIAFIIHGMGICGGNNVVFEHISYLMRKGEDVCVLCPVKPKTEQISWNPKALECNFLSFDEVRQIVFDIVIATSFETVYDFHKIRSNRYAYFVQSPEEKLKPFVGAKAAVNLTYTFPINYITIASHLKKLLRVRFGKDAALVLNGVRKDCFESRRRSKNEINNRLRVLVEGGVGSVLKNVSKAVKLASRSRADEIWLLTNDNIKEYEGVDRVFSMLPINKVADVYRSCDVLLKLSLVEGMYSTPLEMMHCGGTIITYDIPGSEEFVRHNENALVAKTGDEEQVLEYINMLKDDRELLKRLKDGALKTAGMWRSWEQSSNELHNVLKSIPEATDEEKLVVHEMAIAGECLVGHVPDRELFGIQTFCDMFEKLSHLGKPVIIYGAGKKTKEFIEEAKEKDIDILGIAVTDTGDNPAAMYGHKVRSIEDYGLYTDSAVIIIPSRKYSGEITPYLQRLGFKHVMQ